MEAAKHGRYSRIEYARFADNLVILVDGRLQNDDLLKKVERRLREELAKIQVDVNEEKTSVVNLESGDTFGYLGFLFRRVRGSSGKWRPIYTPQLAKRTTLVRKLKDVFRRFHSQATTRVIALINPIVRGWVNYFRLTDHRARPRPYWKESKGHDGRDEAGSHLRDIVYRHH